MEDYAASKRRRGLGVVTPNACTECRKKRAKCDGQAPCARCASQIGVKCVYEIPIRQSKENMRMEIEQLKAQQFLNERVLAALMSSDKSEQVLDQLRSGETLEAILENLDKGKSRDLTPGSLVTTYSQNSDQQAIGNALQLARSIVSPPYPTTGLGNAYGDASQQTRQRSGLWPETGGEDSMSIQVDAPQSNDMMKWSPDVSQVSPQQPGFPLVATWHHQQSGSQSHPDAMTRAMRSKGRGTILGDGLGNPQDPDYTETWTAVTTDMALVEHLMALYFCWEYPTFATLNKEHFLEDFRTATPRYCSSLLVNAMLAAGCRFSSQVAARKDPNDSSTAGDHFFAEAERLLDQEKDHHRLTTIQALGLMSIREASRGHCSKSLYYSGQSIRLAVEMGLHLEMQGDDPTNSSVRSATFWGAFSLDQCWSLSIGRLPHYSHGMKSVARPMTSPEVEASPWIPYTDDGAPLERNCTQPSNVWGVYKTFCDLSEIVHQSLYALYTPGNHVTSKSLLRVYTQYLRWYDSIPEALRLGHNFTPAVLFVHMYYHYAILLLFRPFIKLDIVGSRISPRDVCQQAAEAISTLLNSYDQLYTLRRTPSFVPYFVLTSTITHLVTFGNGRATAERLQQGMSILKTMTPCHGFAERSRRIIAFLNQHWHINIPLKHDGNDEEEDLEAICRPSTTSSNYWCPNARFQDVVSGIGPVKVDDENPLFWPFPFQGRPLLEVNTMLEQSGFKPSMD